MTTGNKALCDGIVVLVGGAWGLCSKEEGHVGPCVWRHECISCDAMKEQK